MMNIKPKSTSYSLSAPMEQLRQITDALLLSNDQRELDAAAVKLHSLLSALSGMNSDLVDSSDSLNLLLSVGEAISPEMLRGVSLIPLERQSSCAG